MDQALYWMWLAGALGLDVSPGGEAVRLYGSARALYEARGQEDLSAQFPRAAARRLRERAGRRDLSTREREVLDLLRLGYTNREIGLALQITEHTAKAHVKAVLAKLEAADRAEAVATGFERGLLRP